MMMKTHLVLIGLALATCAVGQSTGLRNVQKNVSTDTLTGPIKLAPDSGGGAVRGLVVPDGSSILMQNNGQMIMQSGAFFSVLDGGNITVSPGGIVDFEAGAAVSGLSGNAITRDTIAPARLGTGSDISLKYLRGDGTWQTISGGGTPGGSNTQVQFNDSGAFGGDAGLVFDKTTDTLTAGILQTTLTQLHNDGSGNGQLRLFDSGNGEWLSVKALDDVWDFGTHTVSAANFQGSASLLSGLPLTSGVTGILPVANGGTGISSIMSGMATFWGSATSANLRATMTDEVGTGALYFVGGALSTPASGNLSNCTALNATQLTTGTVPDARFPSTLPALNASLLTALNATQLTTGTVPTARLGTGTASSSTYLRGDGTWQTPPSSAAISTPGIAYIQTNGNDTTGTIGDPSKPYLTAQAAYDDGATNFHIGAGITTGITITATGAADIIAGLFVTGCGLTSSNFSVTAEAEDGYVDLRVRSNFTCQFATISGNSTNGIECYVEVYALVVSAFNCECPNGTPNAIAKFCEVGSDLSGLLSATSFMSSIEGLSYP